MIKSSLVDGDEPLIHQELIGGPLAGGVQYVLARHARRARNALGRYVLQCATAMVIPAR
jgi:hypothetical protein